MRTADRLLRGGVRDAAAAIARGDVEASMLVEAALDRSNAQFGTLNAFENVWDEAHLAGIPPGSHPLRGLPVAHKDIFARPGEQPLCGAARAFAGPGLPPSPALRAVQATGAVETGVLTMSEFALGTTGANRRHGNAGNPWQIGRCTGGSSSGSAVAVAAGLVFVSLGTDTGASCRLPASFCGVVGVKPSAGAVPTEGVFPMSWSLDSVGMLARGLDDAAILLAAAQGAPAPAAPQRDATLRIGIPTGYYTDHLHGDVAAAWDAGRRALEEAGHQVRDVTVVETPAIRSLIRLVMRAEAAAIHRPLIAADPDNYPLSVRRFLASGEATLATDYLDALRSRGALLRQALATTFAEVDVLLTPTVPIPPPLYAEVEDAGDPEAWRRITLLAHATQPASFLGLPAVSVPAALTPDGLPIGLQLIGAPGEDAALFRAALPIEQAFRASGASPP